jgi:hypothetical protein
MRRMRMKRNLQKFSKALAEMAVTVTPKLTAAI